MIINRAGFAPSAKGPEDWFTGTVRIDAVAQATAPGRTGVANVTFEPGARTAWHTHPAGQIIVVVSGVGRCQIEGGPIEEIRPGDSVFFPAGVRHWHGAAPKNAMTHTAITESVDGSPVTWLEKVTDDQYLG